MEEVAGGPDAGYEDEGRQARENGRQDYVALLHHQLEQKENIYAYKRKKSGDIVLLMKNKKNKLHEPCSYIKKNVRNSWK